MLKRIISSFFALIIALLPFGKDAPQKCEAKFNGTFIQSWYCLWWDDDRWQEEISVMEEAGIDYLVVQSTATFSGGEWLCYYESQTSALKDAFCGADVIEGALRNCASSDIRVFIGLADYENWWTFGGLTREYYDDCALMAEMEKEIYQTNRGARQLAATVAKKGNAAIGSGFNDDPLWLIAGTDAYLRETGDFTILDEPVAFDCDMSVAEPLLEHLRRSFNYTRTHLGPHGLPLIGRADWNDCLNLNCFSDQPGESFQTYTNPKFKAEGGYSKVAESVMVATLFTYTGPNYVSILKHLGKDDEAAAAQAEIDRIRAERKSRVFN